MTNQAMISKLNWRFNVGGNSLGAQALKETIVKMTWSLLNIKGCLTTGVEWCGLRSFSRRIAGGGLVMAKLFVFGNITGWFRNPFIVYLIVF